MSILTPKRRKYRKQMRGRITGMATRGNKVVFGEFGLRRQQVPTSQTDNLKQPEK